MVGLNDLRGLYQPKQFYDSKLGVTGYSQQATSDVVTCLHGLRLAPCGWSRENFKKPSLPWPVLPFAVSFAAVPHQMLAPSLVPPYRWLPFVELSISLPILKQLLFMPVPASHPLYSFRQEQLQNILNSLR